MQELKALVDRLKVLKNTLPDLVREVIDESEEEIIDLNQQQMFEGINPDGKEVIPPYAPLTIAIKKRKGQPFDRVTRRDTGSFYGKMKVKTVGDIIQISSEDQKAEKLQKKYGDPFGLTEENKFDLSRIVLLPRLEEKIKQTLAIQ